jgi:hypothetical protein
MLSPNPDAPARELHVVVKLAPGSAGAEERVGSIARMTGAIAAHTCDVVIDAQIQIHMSGCGHPSGSVPNGSR